MRLLSISLCVVLLEGLGTTVQAHPFFSAGWNSGGPAIYNAGFEKTWQLESKDEISDGWVLADGGIVYSFSNRKAGVAGVVRLNKLKNKLWEYHVPEGHDNHSCQPLPHGGFLLGECGKEALWMVEIDKNGKEAMRVKVAGAPKDIHHAFRMVRKTPQDTYLGTLMKGTDELEGGCAYEWDASGKLIRTFPGGSFLAVRLENGHTLVSDGHGRNGRLLTEYAPDNSVKWALNEDDLKAAGLSISMVCGFQRLPNGNTIISNVKHGKKILGAENGAMPKAFEMTSDKKVVWKIPPKTSQYNMGSIQILDVPGDVCRFGVWR